MRKTLSSVNCSKSLSPVRISTRSKSFFCSSATVPITSSASNPGFSRHNNPPSFRSSLIIGICSLIPTSMGGRLAWYSLNNFFRNVGLGVSKHTAIWVGLVSDMIFSSIRKKPYTAFVGVPSRAIRVRGSA